MNPNSNTTDKKLKKIREIELRFVGGIVSKLDQEQENIHVRGTERLFDKKIQLHSPNQKLQKSYTFGLQLPETMPSSCKSNKCHVQYVIIVAVY